VLGAGRGEGEVAADEEAAVGQDEEFVDVAEVVAEGRGEGGVEGAVGVEANKEGNAAAARTVASARDDELAIGENGDVADEGSGGEGDVGAEGAVVPSALRRARWRRKVPLMLVKPPQMRSLPSGCSARPIT
jgi:hypothetical protein